MIKFNSIDNFYLLILLHINIELIDIRYFIKYNHSKIDILWKVY